MSRSEPTKLELAIEDLKSYFGITTQSDIFNVMVSAQGVEDPSKKMKALSAAQKDFASKQFANMTLKDKETGNRGIAKIISMIQSQQAGYFAFEIIEEMNRYMSGDNPAAKAKELKQMLTVVYEDTTSAFEAFGPENPGRKTKISQLTVSLERENKKKSDVSKLKDLMLNKSPTMPTKSQPALSAMVVRSNSLNPASRNSSAPELFFNSIPNIEMSRCVPFLDITVIPSAPALDDEGRPQTISISQFLLGNSPIKKGTASEAIAGTPDAYVRKNIFKSKKDTEKESRSKASAGMEIFTSPQTMINGDEIYTSDTPSNRQASVIDRFRPLMSVKNFKVNLAPSAGLMTYKSAEISLVLHDRSRLAEVADFVKPDLYGKTELLITYGWSHPDGNLPGNVFGRFLDSLKCTEKYGIINSNYTFDTVGQVNITLKLSLKGTPALDLSDITSDSDSENALKAVEKIAAAIKASRKKLGGEKKKGSKSVSASSVIGKVSDTGRAMRLTKESEEKINEYIRNASKSKNADVKDLVKSLRAMLKAKTKAQDKMAQLAKNKLSKLQFNRKNELATSSRKFIPGKTLVDYKLPLPFGEKRPRVLIKGKGKTVRVLNKSGLSKAEREALVDPFMVGLQGKNGSKKYVNIRKDDSDYISFGSLLLQYIGYPLAKTGQFNEVQFVFYSFNEYASYVRGAPISSFPIYFPDFAKDFKEASKTTTKMSLNRFLKFVTSKYISSQSSRAYGLRLELYEEDKETGKQKLKEKYKEATLAKGEKDLRLQDAYGESANLSFKVPRIQMHAECLDGKTSDQSIYRIHIYDSNASSHSTFAEILKASESDKITPLTAGIGKACMKDHDNESEAEANSGFQTDFLKVINEALKSGVIETLPTQKTELTKDDLEAVGKKTINFRVVQNFDKVKQMIMRNMPSITYGTQNSNITQASLGSMNSPALSNINMRRSGMGAGNTPLGLRDSGLPLQIAPMQLSVQSMGIPLVVIGQQYFIDFGTGTSADNIYVVSKVSHDISQGKFSSNISFTPLNSYGQYTNIGNVIDQAVAELTSD